MTSIKTKTLVTAAAYLVLPFLVVAQEPAAAPAAAEEPPPPPLFENWKIQVDNGGRNFNLSGDHPGRFLENRDITKGYFINGINLRFESEPSRFSFHLNASNIRELDETITADLSKIGKFRTSFKWDRIPRFFGAGNSFFDETSPGNLVVSPAIRAGFQANVDGQPAQSVPASLAPFARAEAAAIAPTDLRVKWDRVGMKHSIRFGRLELSAKAQTTFQRGSRPKGAGTFARQGTGPQGDGVWEALGSEMPERLDYRTTDLRFGAKVSGVKWRFGFNYGVTLFRNNVGTLNFQNPFRVTNNVGVNAAGVPLPGSAIGRNRYISQQLALPPDTNFHNVTAWWGIDLPKNSQFRGLISWGRSTQNDPFLPFTQNAALNVPLTGSPAGFAETLPAGVSVTSLAALPKRSYNGEVRNINIDSTLVSKPWKHMNFRLQFRSEDMKDKSPNIVFPGFARFGDSHFVTPTEYYGVPIQNLPASFIRRDVIASWGWDISSWATWSAEYQHQTWSRKNRDVPHSNEDIFRGKLEFKLPKNIKFVTDYAYGNRKPDSYRTIATVFNQNLRDTLPTGLAFGPGWEVTRATIYDPTVPLEFSQLRRYDQAARKRYEGKAALDIPLGSKVGFSTSYQHYRNNYAKGFYGLQFEAQASVDAELTFSLGERTFIYLNSSRQMNGYRLLGLGHLICGTQPGGSCAGGAPVNVSACCALFPIANTWDRSSRSTVDTTQTGINWGSSGEKTTISLSYGYSYDKDRIHTFNPYPILVGSPRTAGSYNYPDTRNRFQEVVFSASHKIRPGLELGVQYRFEASFLDDFFLNNLQPYSQGLVTAGGIPINIPRTLLLNARLGTYHAHQQSIFLRYSF